MIIAADQLATEWFLQDDRALTAEEIAGFLASREAVSTGRRAYDYLCDWVAQNANRLKPEIESGDVYGLVEGDIAYIINSVFATACEAAGFNQKAVMSYLKGADLLLTDGNGKSTRTKRIRGSVTRCVALRLPRENDETSIGQCRIPGHLTNEPKCETPRNTCKGKKVLRQKPHCTAVYRHL